LPVTLVYWPADVALGKRVELLLEFFVELIDIANVDIVRKAPISWWRTLLPRLFQQAESHRLAMYISIVVGAIRYLEAQDVGEEGQCPFNIRDMHKGRNLDEV